MITSSRTRLSAPLIRQIAVSAQCDPRSVERLLAGLATRALTTARIAAALRDLGLIHLLGEGQ